jgi:hypothetical protein
MKAIQHFAYAALHNEKSLRELKESKLLWRGIARAQVGT